MRSRPGAPATLAVFSPYRCFSCHEPMFYIHGQEYLTKHEPPKCLVQLSCTCGYKQKFEDSDDLRLYMATHPEPTEKRIVS